MCCTASLSSRTNWAESPLAGNPLYEPLIEREYLTYDTFDHGGVNRVASLYVTLKGLRYCILFADELSRRHGELHLRRVAER